MAYKRTIKRYFSYYSNFILYCLRILFATKIFSLSFKKQDIYRVFMKQTVKENKEPLKLPRIKNAIFNRLNEITNSSTSTN